MLYKSGTPAHDFLCVFLLLLLSSSMYFGGIFNETITSLALVGNQILLKTGSLDNVIREFSLA